MRVGELLRYLVEVGASDLHLKVGRPPTVRVDGELLRSPFDTMTATDTETAAFELLPGPKAEEFRETNEADFGYTAEGMGRFRVNCFRQRGLVGVAIRRVRSDIPTFDELLLPPAAEALASEHRGLVLITGPTGTGKTTTIAAMIGWINEHRAVHIVTIEDPIEVVQGDILSIIDQREIGLDTAETVNRMIDLFPPQQQREVRVSLAASLKGVMCQRLVPRSDGKGRVPAVEVLINTGRVAERILDPEQTNTIIDVIQEGEFYGMQTFDQALVALVRQGLITPDDAADTASSPHDFMLA